MKLWKVWRSDDVDYDEYDSAIIAAETAEQARMTDPSKNLTWCTSNESLYVEEVGEAKPGISAGVILASFRAG